MNDQEKQFLKNLWAEEFTVHNLCGLCGNYGLINTGGTHSPAGVPCGGIFFCICPNGRELKEKNYNRSIISLYSELVTQKVLK